MSAGKSAAARRSTPPDVITDLVRELEYFLKLHDVQARCDMWTKDYAETDKHETGPKMKRDGLRYKFCFVGPQGQGYYLCHCNRARAAVKRAKGKE